MANQRKKTKKKFTQGGKSNKNTKKRLTEGGKSNKNTKKVNKTWQIVGKKRKRSLQKVANRRKKD